MSSVVAILSPAGGSLRHNRYLVDDLTSPIRCRIPFRRTSTSMRLVRSIPACWRSMRSTTARRCVINLVTKRGRTSFRSIRAFTFNHQALSSARAGSQLYEGRLLDQSDPRPPNAGYQFNLNVSGPIVKQKLWFYISTELRHTAQAVVPGPPLNVQHATRGFTARILASLTWAPSARHRLSCRLTPIRPGFTTRFRRTRRRMKQTIQRQGGNFASLELRLVCVRTTSSSTFETGVVYSNIAVEPIAGDRVSPRHTDAANNIAWNKRWTGALCRRQANPVQFDPNDVGEEGLARSAQRSVPVCVGQFPSLLLHGDAGNSTYLDDTGGWNGAFARSDLDGASVRLLPGSESEDGSSATPCLPGEHV